MMMMHMLDNYVCPLHWELSVGLTLMQWHPVRRDEPSFEPVRHLCTTWHLTYKGLSLLRAACLLNSRASSAGMSLSYLQPTMLSPSTAFSLDTHACCAMRCEAACCCSKWSVPGATAQTACPRQIFAACSGRLEVVCCQQQAMIMLMWCAAGPRASVMRQTQAALGLWAQLHDTAATPSTVLQPFPARCSNSAAPTQSTDQSAA